MCCSCTLSPDWEERHSSQLQIFPSISQGDEGTELKQNVTHPDFRGFVVLTCKPLKDNVISLDLSFLSLLIISKPFFFIAVFIYLLFYFILFFIVVQV